MRSAVTFFERHGVAGDIVLNARDALAGVEPRLRLDAYVAAPGDVRPAPVEGVTVHPVGPDEAEDWMSVAIEANGPIPEVAALWRSMTPHMVRAPGWFLSVAEADWRIVGAASLFVTDGVGWQSWASVLPPASRSRHPAGDDRVPRAGCGRIEAAVWSPPGRVAGAHRRPTSSARACGESTACRGAEPPTSGDVEPIVSMRYVSAHVERIAPARARPAQETSSRA